MEAHTLAVGPAQAVRSIWSDITCRYIATAAHATARLVRRLRALAGEDAALRAAVRRAVPFRGVAQAALQAGAGGPLLLW